jgi:hypothetical protein
MKNEPSDEASRARRFAQVRCDDLRTDDCELSTMLLIVSVATDWSVAMCGWRAGFRCSRRSLAEVAGLVKGVVPAAAASLGNEL